LLAQVPEDTPPTNVAYEPIGQDDSEQDVCPAVEVFVPAAQLMHAVSLLWPAIVEYLPMAHGMQTASLVCPGPDVEYLPAVHCAQSGTAADTFTYEPAGHVDVLTHPL
jgi:hypothetical protein